MLLLEGTQAVRVSQELTRQLEGIKPDPRICDRWPYL